MKLEAHRFRVVGDPAVECRLWNAAGGATLATSARMMGSGSTIGSRRATSSTAVGAAMALVVTYLLSQSALADPRFVKSFWDHWGDGHAEISGYQLTFPRYGQVRKGVAVAIYVTETLDVASRVKADRSTGSGPPDELPVIKLNLVEDFPTGIYDYNMMTSVFVGLVPIWNRPAGAVTKIAFSSQEWCGLTHQQVWFYQDFVRHQLHSYFQGEADRTRKIEYPKDGLSEDALLLWARGLAGPRVEPGASVTVPLLRSLQVARLKHVQLIWDEAELSRGDRAEQITVPAGTFTVDRCLVVIQRALTVGRDGIKYVEGDTESRWTIWVESRFPHRVIRYTRDDGLSAELLGADRLKYWNMKGPGFEKSLEKIGLTPRGPRMP